VHPIDRRTTLQGVDSRSCRPGYRVWELHVRSLPLMWLRTACWAIRAGGATHRLDPFLRPAEHTPALCDWSRSCPTWPGQPDGPQLGCCGPLRGRAPELSGPRGRVVVRGVRAFRLMRRPPWNFVLQVHLWDSRGLSRLNGELAEACPKTGRLTYPPAPPRRPAPSSRMVGIEPTIPTFSPVCAARWRAQLYGCSMGFPKRSLPPGARGAARG
jgi:hypothetical protein